MDPAVQEYINGIDDEFRPLFDRLQRLLMKAFPDATVKISYGMPTYQVAKRRVHLAAFKDHVSIYGWHGGRDGGFVERHPELQTGKGTIQLRPATAKKIPDREFTALFRAALSE